MRRMLLFYCVIQRNTLMAKTRLHGAVVLHSFKRATSVVLLVVRPLARPLMRPLVAYRSPANVLSAFNHGRRKPFKIR